MIPSRKRLLITVTGTLAAASFVATVHSRVVHAAADSSAYVMRQVSTQDTTKPKENVNPTAATNSDQQKSGASARTLTIEFIKKYFDLDKDGALNEQEKVKARNWLKQQQQSSNEDVKTTANVPVHSQESILREYDKDQDGKLSKEELKLAKEKIVALKRGGSDVRQERIKELDTDGDGRLNEDERKLLQKEIDLLKSSSGINPALPDTTSTGTAPSGTNIDRVWLLKEFDANKNGELEDDEKERARNAIRDRRNAGKLP